MYVIKLIFSVLLILSIPEVAKHIGTRYAGILLLIPVISITALYLTASTLGVEKALQVNNAALIGLVPLALFFVSINLTLPRYPIAFALVISGLVWLTAAGLSLSIMNLSTGK